MDPIKSKGIVIKKVPYQDSDLVVTFLTEAGEKFTAFAPKARVSKKRFGSAIDLFNLLSFSYIPSKNQSMARLTEVNLEQSMDSLRLDLKKFALACYLSEMALEFMPENEQTPDVYKSIWSVLKRFNILDEVEDDVLPVIQHHFLELFGFEPHLDRCVRCEGDLIESQKYFFQGAHGGVVCGTCAGKVHGLEHGPKSVGYLNNYPLSYGVIQKLLDQRGSASFLSKTHKSWKKNEVLEARRALEYFIQYTLGKPFKSQQFLSQIFQ